MSPRAHTDLVSPFDFLILGALLVIKFSHFFVQKKKNKEFKTALMTSFILLLNITITIDKTHNIYDLI